nr:group II intron maturase-specific domain-containing protein [Streptomyces pluripotens]
MIRHQRAVQEALFVCTQHPATTRSGLPFDAHPSRSKRQQLLNPVLRDWGAYFRNGNSGRTFNAVNGYVHERRAIRAKRQHGLWCRNWSTRFTYGWTTRLRVYRLTGTVRRATAHARR